MNQRTNPTNEQPSGHYALPDLIAGLYPVQHSTQNRPKVRVHLRPRYLLNTTRIFQQGGHRIQVKKTLTKCTRPRSHNSRPARATLIGAIRRLERKTGRPNYVENWDRPGAPHNTTQYIESHNCPMELHEPTSMSSALSSMIGTLKAKNEHKIGLVSIQELERQESIVLGGEQAGWEKEASPDCFLSADDRPAAKGYPESVGDQCYSRRTDGPPLGETSSQQSC